MPGSDVPAPRPLLPILVALAGLASFSMMDGVMKAASLALGAFAAIFWRSTAGALVMAPLWLRETMVLRGGRLPPAASLKVHVLRGVVSAGMAILFFDGVVRMPLAQGMALSFVAPLIALYLAAVTLGEKLSRRAVTGSLLALVGVAVIAADQLGAAPGPDAWRGLVEILTSSVLYAVTLVLQRRQAQLATPVEVAFYQSIVIALLLAPLAVVWAPWPTPGEWGLVLAGAVLAALAMMLLAWAYARAQAQVLVPLEYTAFIWAAIVGWLAFAEPVTRGTIAGVTLIVAGCALATRRDDPPPEMI
ncbi:MULTISPECIES: DMT family transporter [unclassified Sphingomonas]|uniref:DMT family transporter n=1 Tax=Novosphingobium rhizosphaerae TaxID=1551649 RepID=UPI0018336EC2